MITTTASERQAAPTAARAAPDGPHEPRRQALRYAGTIGSMRVGLVQMVVPILKVSTNTNRVLSWFAEAKESGAELVCFPELCLTGYCLERAAYTAKLMDEVSAGIARLQKAVDQGAVSMLIGVPKATSEADRVFNSILMLRPGLRPVNYHKIHLDTKERAVFAPGDSFVTVDGDLGLACCYDVAFPEMSRILALQGARVLLFPMAWEAKRAFVMRNLRRARALENVAYVVCANQTGSHGGYHFIGGSCVIDPLGRVVAGLGSKEGMIVTDLDLDCVDRMRKGHDDSTYPLFADRRASVYLREDPSGGTGYR